ncbi:MAG: hypothetical protein KDK22_12555 [Rhodobacteraceae bacterium]|nr:hypothetical protein [Paracoccaceae bacterium]
MKPFRALQLVLLVLLLVCGSYTMASARHQARAVGQTVVCTGYGVTTITIDAQGNPVPDGPMILCPDCVPALAALTDSVTPLIRAPSRLTPVRYARRVTLVHQPEAPVHWLSRAPPAGV